MSQVSSQASFAVPPEKIWEVIGNFNALPTWHPAVESSNLEEGGMVRRMKIVGGGEIVERLEGHADDTFTYSYSVLSGLPVTNYRSTIRVVPDGEGSCKVEWSSDFEPASGASLKQTEELVNNIYTAGLDNLRKMFGG